MTVREWYSEAIIGKHHYLKLLIEFLIYEKKVLTFEDATEKLSYYLQDKFKNRMNQLINEYSGESISQENEVNVYQIRQEDTFYFVTANTKEQAENFFKKEYGEIQEIRIELPELQVEGASGMQTLKQIMAKTKKCPSILGSWELIGG